MRIELIIKKEKLAHADRAKSSPPLKKDMGIPLLEGGALSPPLVVIS